MATASAVDIAKREHWLNYRTIWRWHFYAGLFCIPFVLWLATTGSIYLFKPQIESWLDRPYENLPIVGSRASAAEQVKAAVAAVPGSNLHFFQMPRSEHSAVQIIVGRGVEAYRVYVNPYTLQVMNIVNEDARLMPRISHLHGELLIGDRGSYIVETAASWAIIMILTGSICGGRVVLRALQEFYIPGSAKGSAFSGAISMLLPACGFLRLRCCFC